MTTNPYNPSRNTNFKALSSYLLKIHFSMTNPILLKIIDPRRRRIPSNYDETSPLDELFEYITATTCTPVIPTKASTHPKIDVLLNTLLRKKRDRIAVKMMFPPLEICHTELSTIFNAV